MFGIKKLSKTLFVFSCAILMQSTNAVTVGDFDMFNYYLGNSSTQIINLNSDIYAYNDLNEIQSNNLSINGNGHFLDGDDYYGFWVFNGTSLDIKNITVGNFYGSAIYNEGIINSVDNVTFQGNYVDEYEARGGAINSTKVGVINKITSSNFIENMVESYDGKARGGAITFFNTVEEISNSQFIENGAFSERGDARGGAIYVNLDSNVNVIKDSLFKENAAYSPRKEALGGAIASWGDLVLIDNVTFENNAAISDGANARGGAIYIEDNHTLGTITNSSFVGNLAETQSGKARGGAIAYWETISEISNSIFEGNHANSYNGNARGGAIYGHANASIDLISNVTFKENYAHSEYSDARGGAIYFDTGSNNSLITNSVFDSNYTSAYNDDSFGGAIANYGNIALIDGVTFENNSAASLNADSRGGAIYSAQGATIENISNSTFKNNIAYSEVAKARGGAIAFWGNIKGITNTIFEGNYAKSYDGNVRGGAIFGHDNASIDLISSVTFKDNYVYSEYSDAAGGALFVDTNSNIQTILDSEFIGNKVVSLQYEARGGAIGFGGNIKEISNTLFEDNGAESIDGEAFGGAIYGYENTSIDVIKNSSFKNNYVLSENNEAVGGALFVDMNSNIQTILDSEFIGNKATSPNAAAYGGAILLSVSVDEINNVLFKQNQVVSDFGGMGGANAALEVSIGDLKNISFIENSVEVGNVNSNGNQIVAAGGAFVLQASSIINMENISFDGNHAIAKSNDGYNNSLGGAFALVYSDIQNFNNIQFLNNSAESYDGYKGETFGGAMYISESIIGDLNNVSFIGNSVSATSQEHASASGGAVYLNVSGLGDLNNVSFIGNSVSATSQEGDANAYGGAIANLDGIIGNINNAVFENNSASATSQEGNAGAGGGAIFNDRYIEHLTNVSFVHNSVKSDYSAVGGAICSFGYLGYLDNVSFIGNSANSTLQDPNMPSALGGAIAYLSDMGLPLNILSSTGDTIFVGNSANGKSDAIVFPASIREEYWDGSLKQRDIRQTAVINLNAGDYKITILDELSSYTGINKDYYDENGNWINNESEILTDAYEFNTININNPDNEILLYDSDGNEIGIQEAPSSGKVILGNKIDGYTVNFYDGELVLTHHTYTKDESEILAGQTGVANFTDNTVFNIYGGSLFTMDNAAYSHHLGNLALNADIKMTIDADLAAEKMDMISVNSFDNLNNSIIDVTSINLVSPTQKEYLELSFINPEYLNNNDADIANANQALADSVVYSGGEVAYSPIYKYQVGYNNSNGKFTFNKEALNPSILSTQSAAQSGMMATQVATFTEAFYHMDTFMTHSTNERIMMRDANKYASIFKQGMLWDNAITRRDNREAWYRPYVTIESVSLKNGPKVDNVAYGTFLGTNSKIIPLKNGWDSAWGVFVGYNGSKQSYSGVDSRQNGATLGFVGELYKKNFFTGFSVNAGASMSKADTMFGSDDFTSIIAGFASKTGYNFEFKEGRYIIQPSLLLGYSFINTFDFTSDSGVKISSEPIHSIHLEPGVKVISPRKNGWRPYAHLSMVWNINDKAKFKADGYALPETSIKPYIKYGVGAQRNWSDRITSFLQAFLTHGGRNGVGFQFGFSYLF